MNPQQQLTIDFHPGLLEQFPAWMDCVRASVYGCGRQFKAIAADLDMSVSELSRKLNDNPADNVNFPLALLPQLMQSTRDLRPLYWLVATFLNDPEAERRRAARELSQLLPIVRALAEKSGLAEAPKPSAPRAA